MFNISCLHEDLTHLYETEHSWFSWDFSGTSPKHQLQPHTDTPGFSNLTEPSVFKGGPDIRPLSFTSKLWNYSDWFQNRSFVCSRPKPRKQSLNRLVCGDGAICFKFHFIRESNLLEGAKAQAVTGVFTLFFSFLLTTNCFHMANLLYLLLKPSVGGLFFLETSEFFLFNLKKKSRQSREFWNLISFLGTVVCFQSAVKRGSTESHLLRSHAAMCHHIHSQVWLRGSEGATLL